MVLIMTIPLSGFALGNKNLAEEAVINGCVSISCGFGLAIEKVKIKRKTFFKFYNPSKGVLVKNRHWRRF